MLKVFKSWTQIYKVVYRIYLFNKSEVQISENFETYLGNGNFQRMENIKENRKHKIKRNKMQEICKIIREIVRLPFSVLSCSH